MRLNYSFTALTPLFTGAAEKSGTTSLLRREKRRLKNKINIESKFSSQNERTRALMDIIYYVYSDIDPKLKRAYYGFYDAYTGKLKAATYVKTKREFLTRLLSSCGIDSLSTESSLIVRQAIDKFDDLELLETIRQELSYLMILLREYVEFFKNKSKLAHEGLTNKGLFDSIYEDSDELPAIETITIVKDFENIPYFSGNSIRGYLRRLLMNDFCKLADISAIEKSTYHQLFTGGNITDSTEFEDISKREEFIKKCPPIGLFGSAIGNMTIDGNMLVQGARLQCVENNSGDASFYEYLDLNFGTRSDSSKSEDNLKLVKTAICPKCKATIVLGDDEKAAVCNCGKKIDVKEAPSQMIYQYETFITGSGFDSSFILKKIDELSLAVFWRMIKLWKEMPVIGGNSARDAGVIDIDIDIENDADAAYLSYIEENKEAIKEYFNV